MTTEEIQHFLQTLHQESLESHLDAPGLYADAESLGLKYVKPAPGRAALTFAGFTIEEQEQIVEYAEMLIDEAHALCRRLQARCPILRDGDCGELWDLERVYKAQYHAMARLRQRCDEGL